MIPTKGTYKCQGSSVFVVIHKLQYADTVKAKVKLSFVYKNGAILETKNYTLVLAQIQHWEKVYETCISYR